MLKRTALSLRGTSSASLNTRKGRPAMKIQSKQKAHGCQNAQYRCRAARTKLNAGGLTRIAFVTVALSAISWGQQTAGQEPFSATPHMLISEARRFNPQ